MNQLIINLTISKEELLKYYQGAAGAISAIAETGQRVQFPVTSIKSHIDHNGLSGRFALIYDNKDKLLDIVKLSL